MPVMLENCLGPIFKQNSLISCRCCVFNCNYSFFNYKNSKRFQVSHFFSTFTPWSFKELEASRNYTSCRACIKSLGGKAKPLNSIFTSPPGSGHILFPPPQVKLPFYLLLGADGLRLEFLIFSPGNPQELLQISLAEKKKKCCSQTHAGP